MERKYVTLIILWGFCFLLSCGGEDGYGDFDSDFTLEWGVAVDDLDLDGAVDIVGTWTDSDDTHYSSVILNDLNLPGSFFLSDELELQGSKRDWPSSVITGDLNDDGYSDIVAENGEAIFILFQDSTLPGQFFVPLKIAVGEFTASLAIGDLNEDGYNDLAISGSGPHLSILFQDSLNPDSFLPLVNLGIISSSVAIGDLDGDFINDMAVTVSSSGEIKVLLQDPAVPGNFTVAMDRVVGSQATDVKIGDLDKDGNSDLVVGIFGPPDNFKKGSVSVLLQDPINVGQFLPTVNYSFNCRASEISLADLNDDGFLDIAVASGCEKCKVTILFQDISNIGTFLPAVKYSCKGYDPWSIATGDMNNDNFNDLIISEDGFVIRYQDSSSPGSFLERTKIYDPK